MPALLVDTSTSTPTVNAKEETEGSSSPDLRPPVSPITPTITSAQLAPLPITHTATVAPPPPPPATFRPQPSSVAINESENPDAIALRSAISLLQLQREKSKRDIQALQELKTAAVSDPQAFARSLQEQRANAAKSRGDVLTPTLSDITDAARKEIDGDGDDQEQSRGGAERKDSAGVEGTPATKSKFPPIPQPQNVIRCPPVNWAKYHVVGESLDKMHEEQRRYPGSTEPPRTHQGTKAPPHAVAAPYSPFTDGIGDTHAASQNLKPSKKSP